ncbi:sodium/calcium transporter [Rhizoctonia solani AG-1 IA]|uniref:Sodium/calcium transporter n=1 Tax=Thanatephorus cucumeris (strain AG1-IA) TaxID=983506 RepID=L8WVB0_THACA|nr:sodium/calcium transporter [Rhizoctonia solani AG-1 IA]
MSSEQEREFEPPSRNSRHLTSALLIDLFTDIAGESGRPSTSTSPFHQNSVPTVASASTHPESLRPLNPSQPDLRQRTAPRPSLKAVGLVAVAIRRMMTPQKKLGKEPTYLSSLRAIVTETCMSLFEAASYVAVFITNFLAIIPLAKLLGFATEELALRVGQTIGGLLNATFGNAVELIVAVRFPVDNLLLVFAGGTRYSEQGFMAGAAQLNSSLLAISVIAVLLPAAFHFATNQQADPDEGLDILRMSHGVAVVLLLIYAGYLFFQLWSHAHLYDEGEHAGFAEPSTAYPNTGRSLKGLARSAIRRKKADEEQPAEPSEVKEKEEEVEEPKLNVVSAVALLVVITVLVAFTAEYLVDSIDGVTEGGAISKEFVGLILLPIVGNAAEHVTAVTVSVKDKLDLSIGVAVGSSIQIALFVIPLLVVIAWGMGKPFDQPWRMQLGGCWLKMYLYGLCVPIIPFPVYPSHSTHFSMAQTYSCSLKAACSYDFSCLPTSHSFTLRFFIFYFSLPSLYTRCIVFSP